MTLLRRAPREVYRVYGEEEFLAGADVEEATDASGDAGRASHRVVKAREGRGQGVRRAAVAILLAAALGALGGLIVLRGMPRRADGRARPTGSLGKGAPARSTSSSGRTQEPQRSTLSRVPRVRPAASWRTPRTRDTPGARSLGAAGGGRAALAIDQAQEGIGTSLTASARSASPPAGSLEFGFER